MNVLDEAMEVIEREGWYPGMHNMVSGVPHRHCIVTAIQEVIEDERLRERAWTAVAEEIGHTHHTYYTHHSNPFLAWLECVRFNDDSRTSLEDVMLVMKRASARLDSVD